MSDIIPDYETLVKMYKESKQKEIKSGTLETTLPDYALLKSLLHKIELEYDVKVIIESEESFTFGTIFKTTLVKTFFHFVGKKAHDAYEAAEYSIKDYIERFTSA